MSFGWKSREKRLLEKTVRPAFAENELNVEESYGLLFIY